MESFPVIRYEVNQSLVTAGFALSSDNWRCKQKRLKHQALYQAAPNPSSLGTLHLLFPIACLSFLYRNIRIDITHTDDEGF